MKKSLIVALLLAVVAAPAFATSALILNPTVDQALTGAGKNPLSYDYQDDGMIESLEFGLIEYILADATRPNHNAVHAAYLANETYLLGKVPQINPTYILFTRIWIIMATLGTPETIAAMNSDYAAYFGAFAISTNDFNTSCASFLAPGGDFDGDGYTNLEEYTANGGLPESTPLADSAALAAVRAAFYPGVTTPTVVTTDLTISIAISPRATLFEGAAATLTATTQNGTAPLTIEWFRGATSLGTGTSVALTGALTDAGVYTAVVTDSTNPLPANATSNAITVSVLAASNLPAMGIIGVALLVGLAGALGVRKIRK